MSRESLRLIQRYEEAIAQLEEEAIAQLDESLDRAYRELERELLRRYERYSQGGFDLLGTQRSQQLINDLRGLLQVVRPEQAAEYEAIFRALIEQSGALGSELAVGLINEVDPGSLIRAFTGLPIEAVAAQARDSRERLQRHGDRFAREASVLIQSSLLQGHGATRAARALRSQLGTTKSRAETIARTESMTALNRAAQETYASQGLQVQWIATPSDALCEFCGWRNMQVYVAGRVIVPAHPRCLCILAPYSEKWQALGLTDDDFALDYRNRNLAAMAEQGIEPNEGLTPFERSAGLAEPPRSFWVPGQ